MTLDETRTVVDRELQRILDRCLEGAPEAVATPVRYAVLAPGKRIRPLLVMAAHRAVDGTGVPREVPLRLACAVELVHAYSLVHDDLPCMDDDRLRRGRPTVHVRFGTHRAILAGASLMPLAVELVGEAASTLGPGNGVGPRLVGVLTSAAGASGMVGGQLLDLRAEGRDVSPKELERIHMGKTARLIEAACLLGGLSAGAGEARLRHLRRYGRSLGLAFQVVDDILDVTGVETSMGKVGGRDAALGKATYPEVIGLDAARRRAGDLVDGAVAEARALARPDRLVELAHLVLERDR